MALEPLPLGDTLGFFGLPADLRAAPLGRGLIHRTLTLAQGTSPEYVLQEINTRVFADPGLLDANLRAISAAFRVHHPEAAFVHPVASPGGATQYRHPASGRYFRIFPFVTNTVSHDTVSDADTAFEAARQFGLFARRLSCLPIDAIRPSLPRFHDLDLRVAQFERSLREGNPDRIATCAALIQRARAQLGIAEGYRAALASGALIPRLMHHDTKISNVLFDARSGKGICVVDLDTVMPGVVLSDIGDMLRTYVCPVDENHRDLNDIAIRPEVHTAIAAGYLDGMGDVLTGGERALFDFSGKFMIFMQALRFLTDHLNDDVYYGAAYPGQNRDRAANQLTLLERFSACLL
ncbi:MAG TPA: aminoglycoside phosphotransferase family protein [Thermoflexales bacterium]|nr:aminoglycoside phosphotransferase family protein [Thermoflexales bacterium]